MPVLYVQPVSELSCIPVPQRWPSVREDRAVIFLPHHQRRSSRYGDRTMSRFFIHVRCGNTLTEDLEGYDLPTFEEAQNEALAAAREILANGLKSESLSCEQLEIHDEAGQYLSTVSVRDAVAGCGVAQNVPIPGNTENR